MGHQVTSKEGKQTPQLEDTATTVVGDPNLVVPLTNCIRATHRFNQLGEQKQSLARYYYYYETHSDAYTSVSASIPYNATSGRSTIADVAPDT